MRPKCFTCPHQPLKQTTHKLSTEKLDSPIINYFPATKADAWRNLWIIGLHKIFAVIVMGVASRTESEF
jgi:hypothetical protein